MENQVLSTTDTEKDVRVVFDSCLNFDSHIYNTINKATRVIGIIFRSFTSIDAYMFVVLYKSIIRPTLEYGNLIWSPLFKRQSILIENVQRRATKLLQNLVTMSYEERLTFLKLPSLKYRRKRGDLIQLYKLVHGVDNIDHTLFFEFSPVTFTRGDNFNIFITRCSTSIRKN